jgi:hypothetical protein
MARLFHYNRIGLDPVSEACVRLIHTRISRFLWYDKNYVPLNSPVWAYQEELLPTRATIYGGIDAIVL